MAITAQSETRNVDRLLQYTRDRFLPGIFDNAYNNSPLTASLFGRSLQPIFGERAMNARGRNTQNGGESIVVRVRLGKNDTVKNLSGPFDTITTDPQSNVRFARANWRLKSAAITLSEHDLGVNTGVEALSSIVEDHSSDAVNSLVDDTTAQMFDNLGVANAPTDLDTIISANDTVQGLSGATYENWNSRGLSARGTAAASISFAGGAFNLADWRTAYNNATEGRIRPDQILTTWDIFGFYEGDLQPQERFTNTATADAGFTNLMFKSAQVLGDAKAASGYTYFLNYEYLGVVMLAGFDFSVGPFERAEQQPARVSKVLWTGNLITKARKYQNKITGQTA